MGFDTFWHGSAPQSEVSGYTPWIQSPSYNFSSKLYDYLSQMIGQPTARYKSPYGGQGGANAGPAIAPSMQALMGLGRRFMNTGMPTTFGTGVSSLGRFMAPSFANPLARLQMGAPNYFGAQGVPSQISPTNPTPAPNYLRLQ